jgi:hypothetical protein
MTAQHFYSPSPLKPALSGVEGERGQGGVV